MKIFAKSAGILGLAGLMSLAIPAVSNAQAPFDTWAHVATPAPNGLCWIPTDLGYVKEFGYGYWGLCPSTRRSAALARAEARAEAWRARAEVPMPAIGMPDTWAHVTNPAPGGVCWHQSDLGPYKEFGYGYWGDCPASAAPAAAMRARAQAPKSSRKKSYR